MKIVGIDPGKTGAIALLEDGRLIEVLDMPVTKIKVAGKIRKQLVPADLTDILVRFAPDIVMLESVGVRPKEGAVGAFSFGRSFGTLEGVTAALRLPCRYVIPAVWKRALNLSSDKTQSRVLASELFPNHADKFKRVKDDGRAEAVLIALYTHQMKERLGL